MEIFESLYNEYSKSVFAYFNICLGREVAENLTQQTFMNIFKHISKNKFFMPQSWKAWIFRIAINAKNDYLRQNIGKETLELEEFSAVEEGIEERSTTALTVRKALSVLSKADKEIIILKYFGISSDEMARITGVTPSAARSRLNTAKQRFVIALQNEGLYLPEAKNE